MMAVGLAWFGYQAHTQRTGRLGLADTAVTPGDLRSLTASATAQAGQPTPSEAAVDPGAVLVAVAALGPIEFDHGSTELTEEARHRLTTAIPLLQQLCGRARIRVVGHTDTSGAAEDNLIISQARAATVVAFLVDAGLDGTMLEAEGRGETEPLVAPETEPEHRRQNRRIEWELSPAL